jgi:hypothetical protein
MAEWELNIFRATRRSSSGAQKLQLQPLVLHSLWLPAAVMAEWEFNMFRATRRSSTGAQKLQLQLLVLHTFVVAGSCRQPQT